MNIWNSNSLFMMEKSMQYLWTKQGAILDNIANAETPGYQTKYVTFEESLREALGRTQHARRPKAEVRNVLDQTEPQVQEAKERTRMDGNGVNLAEQNVELSRYGYQMQYVMHAINSEFSTLRTAIKGQ